MVRGAEIPLPKPSKTGKCLTLPRGRRFSRRRRCCREDCWAPVAGLVELFAMMALAALVVVAVMGVVVELAWSAVSAGKI